MKNKVLLSIEIILYCIATFFTVFCFDFTYNFNSLCFYIGTLILNILLAIWIARNKKCYWLKIVIFNLFVSAFVILTPGVIKSFYYDGNFVFIDLLKYMLFILFHSFIMGNWLIPLIVNNIVVIITKKKNAEKSHSKVVEIDGKHNRTTKKLLKTIAKELEFPPQAGETWNSLNTCLHDLGWIKCRKIVIFINNPDFLLIEERKSERKLFRNCLKAASDYWRREMSNFSKVDGVMEFTVVYMDKLI